MQAWRPIADMADTRAYGSCAVLAGTLFAVGGLQSDMQVGTWRAAPHSVPVATVYRCCPASLHGRPRRASLSDPSDAHAPLCSQTHAALVEAYNPAVDGWEPVELPSNANPRRSFLAACGLE